jgi:hypothetical protein
MVPHLVPQWHLYGTICGTIIQVVNGGTPTLSSYAKTKWEDRMRITYDHAVDALHIRFSEDPVTTLHLADGITADYDADGHLAVSRCVVFSRRPAIVPEPPRPCAHLGRIGAPATGDGYRFPRRHVRGRARSANPSPRYTSIAPSSASRSSPVLPRRTGQVPRDQRTRDSSLRTPDPPHST